MRMFAEVLALAHKDELAREAEHALERLLRLVRHPLADEKRGVAARDA